MECIWFGLAAVYVTSQVIGAWVAWTTCRATLKVVQAQTSAMEDLR